MSPKKAVKRILEEHGVSFKPLCPKCGEPVVKGGSSRGTQRWMHSPKQHRKCPWHGHRPIYGDEAASAGIDPKAVGKLHKRIRADKREVRRYVITAAQNATPVHAGFFASLRTYCEKNHAQLIVIPIRYKNPTSIWSDRAKDDDWWASEVVPYLLDRRLELNRHLVVLGDIKTQPTATSPLNGFDSISGAMSAIIGHPQLALKTVPTPQAKLPKIITTTGAVTQKNYIPTKAGKQGEFHHTFGAAVVEVKGDVFHLRQLNAIEDGSFMDLNWEYRGDKRTRVDRIEALIMGDSHLEFLDPEVRDATWGYGGIIPTLQPKVLVFHDIHDFFSKNHHHRGEVFTNYAKHHAGVDDVRRMLQETFDFIDHVTSKGATPADMVNVFVPSNHPDALARWVKESDPKSDPRNALFWAETFTAMCRGARITESGAETIDPFVYWAERMMKTWPRAKFLKRDESFTVKGIELTYHGDRGPSGARGSLKGFTKLGVKTITGHSHTPGIDGGAYAVGTNSRLRLEYNSGPSSWLHTDCVIYANGKRSLINIIGGEWRA